MTDLTERLTKTERDQSHPDSEPRDAATLILVDRAEAEPKVLLGKRHHSHKFMPGKFVFPGGRVEPSDAQMSAASELVATAAVKLTGRVSSAAASPRAFALAAIRETYEETGLLLGTRTKEPPVIPGVVWQGFADAGVHPDLAGMHFIARAITPPMRPRRFDTRFFAADATAVAHRLDGVTGPDAELVELVWIPIREAEKLDMPTITGVVLEELEKRVADGFGHELPVPFYYVKDGRFVREEL